MVMILEASRDGDTENWVLDASSDSGSRVGQLLFRTLFTMRKIKGKPYFGCTTQLGFLLAILMKRKWNSGRIGPAPYQGDSRGEMLQFMSERLADKWHRFDWTPKGNIFPSLMWDVHPKILICFLESLLSSLFPPSSLSLCWKHLEFLPK